MDHQRDWADVSASHQAMLMIGAGAFSPPNISGLVLWLDASDASTFSFSSGSSVSQWRDKSTSAANHGQGTASVQPNRNGTLNGKSTVVFDGTDDNLINATVPLLRNVPGWTAFVLSMTTDVTQYGISFQVYSDAIDTWSLRLAMNVAGSASGKATVCGRRVDGGTGTCFNSTNSVSNSVWYTNTFVSDLTNTDAFFYLNGALENSDTAWLSSGNTSNANGLSTLGQRGGDGGNGNHWKGPIAEVILYNTALSTGDRERVEAYLRAKWAHY